MHTTITSKGQVTIPKRIRDALHLEPGSAVQFALNDQGQVVLSPAKKAAARGAKDRFAAARGKATVKWRTDDLMKLLHSDD
jgi:antitoxin PrlF